MGLFPHLRKACPVEQYGQPRRLRVGEGLGIGDKLPAQRASLSREFRFTQTVRFQKRECSVGYSHCANSHLKRTSKSRSHRL